MTTLKARIEALETRRSSSLPMLIIASPDETLTPAQEAQKREAELSGRRCVVLYNAPDVDV